MEPPQQENSPPEPPPVSRAKYIYQLLIVIAMLGSVAIQCVFSIATLLLLAMVNPADKISMSYHPLAAALLGVSWTLFLCATLLTHKIPRYYEAFGALIWLCVSYLILVINDAPDTPTIPSPDIDFVKTMLMTQRIAIFVFMFSVLISMMMRRGE